MKHLAVYPAIFHQDTIGEKESYWVEFPDLPGCNTQGLTLEEATLMAQDVLGLFLMDEVNLPVPSSPKKLTVDDGFISMISVDMAEYRRKHNSKAIKKTLTIPEWLNVIAEKEKINFSQTLQEALIEKLHLR